MNVFDEKCKECKKCKEKKVITKIEGLVAIYCPPTCKKKSKVEEKKVA